jgi:putative PIN family toxin of toxin-antitoxin system
MRAVLDTNVIVSAAITPGGVPDAILRAWRQGSFQLITSAPLLAELAEVLARPRIRQRTGFTATDELAFVTALADTATVVAHGQRLSVVEDPDDNLLIEAAVAAEADFVVSGDTTVLKVGSHGKVAVVTPSRFLALLVVDAET